jgi:transcriptional regulator with XRE-family HTH domain
MYTSGHVKLRQYLATKGLGLSEFAGLAGLSLMQVSHLYNGRRRASFEVAFAIEEATNGEIKAESWLETRGDAADEVSQKQRDTNTLGE